MKSREFLFVNTTVAVYLRGSFSRKNTALLIHEMLVAAVSLLEVIDQTKVSPRSVGQMFHRPFMKLWSYGNNVNPRDKKITAREGGVSTYQELNSFPLAERKYLPIRDHDN